MTKQLITLTDPRSAAAEAYRSLYVNLSFSSQDKPLHTLLITSAVAGEGKSTTLANLAVVAAQMGHRVIVVDCDLRQPQQHELLGIRNDSGVSTVTSGKDSSTAALQGVADLPGLQVLTSGPLPVSPTQVLASKPLEELLASLVQQADLILLDAPPVVAVSDAAVLASKVDGVVLVLNAGHTKRDLARRAKETLEKAHANIVGAVLNNVADAAAVRGY